jgi:hypothetical protein
MLRKWVEMIRAHAVVGRNIRNVAVNEKHTIAEIIDLLAKVLLRKVHRVLNNIL